MPTTFAYTAIEPSGRKKSGFVDAANREAAIAAITAEGRYVLELREQAAKAAALPTEGEHKRKGSVSRADIALFSRRLSDLADAGLPLDRVLQIVAQQSESAMLAEISLKALEEVRGGKAVSDALSQYPKLFPQVYTQTLRAGEASGQFPQVAGRLADFQEKEVARRSTIVSALIYPVLLTIVAMLVIVVLITFVMPKLTPLFEKQKADLPTSTQALLIFTNFVNQQGLLILGGAIALFLFYKAYTKTDAGALARDRFLLRAPLAGAIIRKATVSRFASVLGTLVFGGVPILEALEIAGLSAGNRYFYVSAKQVEHEVREGRSIAESMRDAGAFPPVLTHMVAIGEETGDLPKMLGRVSDSLDFEVDNGMRRLTSIIEPMVVLVMGGFVGFVVVSVLMAIYSTQDLVSK